ncbi:hypothetical protein MMC29_006174 [Sticta canariensis]|nr:hypothetical protein [Sticta canariensis]
MTLKEHCTANQEPSEDFDSHPIPHDPNETSPQRAIDEDEGELERDSRDPKYETSALQSIDEVECEWEHDSCATKEELSALQANYDDGGELQRISRDPKYETSALETIYEVECEWEHDSCDLGDPEEEISAQLQQLIRDRTGGLSSHLTALDPLFIMSIGLNPIAPTEIDDKFSTSTDTGPAMPIVTIAVPGSVKYTFESMRSLRQELKLCRGAHFVRVHWDPARTSTTQIQDSDEFRRRSPSIWLFDPNKEEQGIQKDRTPQLFSLSSHV